MDDVHRAAPPTQQGCELGPGASASVNLDWEDGRLVGVKVLQATAGLHRDLLEQGGDTTGL